MTGGGGEWSVQLLRGVLDAATEGVVVCEATDDRKAVYANAAFAQLTGYEIEEILGSNLRRLQGTEREQEGLKRLREALTRAEPVRVVLRNFRKDGTPFWNEMSIQPLADAGGRVTHFAGYHREAADRPRSGERPSSAIAARSARSTSTSTAPAMRPGSSASTRGPSGSARGRRADEAARA